MTEEVSGAGPSRRGWAAFFTLITLAILAGGYRYYRAETEKIRREKYQTIAAIGELKAGQILQWRTERLNEADRLARDPFVREAVEECLREPDDRTRGATLRERLRLEQMGDIYSDALLLDPSGNILLAARDNPDPVDTATKRAVTAALADHKATLSDLYRCPSGHVHLDAVMPVLDAGGRPLVMVVLRSNAEAYLYPLIQSWPTPSRSAETLLVQREGDEIVYLNELRHQPETALSLRLPLSRTELPAVQAVLGKEGVFDGRDYRGIAVLADMRPLPGTLWFMVAKVDRSEILAEARYRALVITFFAFLLILLAAAVTAFAYRQRQAGLYRDMYRSEREKREAQEEFRATLYCIGDAVISTDKAGRVRQLNPVAEQLIGWTEAEARDKPLDEVFHIINEETRAVVENAVARVLREGLVVGLANHTLLIARDGTERPIADSGAPIRDESGGINGVVLVFRDQTAERAAQNALAASEVRYRRLFEAAKDGILILDAETGTVVDANPFLIGLLGFSHDQLLGKTLWELGFFKDIVANKDKFLELQKAEFVRYEDLPLKTADGRPIHVEFVSNVYLVDHKKVIQCNIRDVTERKQAEIRERLAHKVLELLNRQEGASDTIRDILQLVKQNVDIEALGVRLHEGDDFPYHDINGFPEDFVRAERYLCERDAAGNLVCDGLGNPILECMCGNVLRGRTDATLPFFTVGGSFWTNSTTKLLASTTEKERQSPIRNRCNRAGYESVALIPLRSSGEIIGLLQLNDHRADRFTPEMIRFLEGLGASIGVALGRKRAEEELARLNHQLELILCSAAEGILGLDSQGNHMFVNPAAARMLGYEAEELLGRHSHSTWHHTRPDGSPYPKEECEIYAAYRDGTVHRSSTEVFWRKDGTSFPVEYASTPIHEQDRLTGAVVTFADITERKRAEEEIRSLAKFPSEDPSPILRVAQNGVLLHVNESGLRLLPEWGLQVGQAAPPMLREVAVEALNSGSPRGLDLEHGGRVYSFSVAPVVDAGYANLYGRDVTEIRRVDAALRESEQRYRLLFNNMLEGLAYCEMLFDDQNRPVDFVYLAVNRAFGRLTGLRNVVGKRVTELMPGIKESSPELFEIYGRVALSGEPAQFEFDFKPLALWLSISAYSIEKGCFVAVFDDITARKRAEEEREKLEAQLLQAQKMEAVGRLAGGVAHDFNNILHAILGYSQLLSDGLPEQDETHGFAGEIAREAARAAALTRQLLAFARKQTIAPQVLDLNDAIAGMLKMRRRLIGEDIDLLWLPAADLWPVKIDPAQIDQILANLVINSRDAIAGVGKVTIETATAEFEQDYCNTHAGFVPGQYVLLAVSDNGCGMDKETMAKIFEPFFTTKPQGQGTGLGLATVYGIVKQNHGFINAYSEPGKGTTFRIYLPAHASEELVSDKTRPAAEAPPGTETVLLVEDEAALLNLAETQLAQLGYTVLAAASPRQAIQLAGEYQGVIHLLVTDVVMPEMNGRDLWHELVALRPGLKCLFMSGYTPDAIAHHDVLEGGIHFLQKPFSREAFAAKLREALGP